MNRMTQSAQIALIMTSLVAFAALPIYAQPEADCSKAPWSAFDDLAGEFNLDSAGQLLGTASVRRVANGCGLASELIMGDDQIFSTASFNGKDGIWSESAVISSGSVAHTTGKPKLRRGVLEKLELTGSVTQADGTKNLVESTYSRAQSGNLRHTVRVQRAGSWVEAFDVVYVPTKEAGRLTKSGPKTRTSGLERTETKLNAPTVVEVQATEPQGQGGIRVTTSERSARVQGQSRVGKVVVESPMSVQLPLGPLDKIPAGYGWRSTDLAQYEVDGGTIEIVEIKKQTKRKRTSLVITFFGQSPAYTAEFELTLQLVTADGEPLSEVVTGKLYTGRAVGAQATGGVSKATLELVTDAVAFGAAFEDDQRPVLNIKVVALG